ncbi:MAG: hypothetical protein AAB427_15375, partial [Chloroflexota bacterium]
RVGSATLEQVRAWGYPPRHLLAFFIPNVFGNPAHHGYFDLFIRQWVPATVNALGQPITKIDWGIKNYVEGGAYVGILPMLLAAFGILSIFHRQPVDSPARMQSAPTNGPATTRLPDHPTTRLPDHPTTRLPDYSTTRLQKLFFAALGFLSL